MCDYLGISTPMPCRGGVRNTHMHIPARTPRLRPQGQGIHLHYLGIHLRPLCDIPSGGCFFTGPWTVTRSSLRMLRRVAAFCRPLRPDITPAASGIPTASERGAESEVAPKRGRNCYVTPAFSAIPKKGG